MSLKDCCIRQTKKHTALAIWRCIETLEIPCSMHGSLICTTLYKRITAYENNSLQCQNPSRFRNAGKKHANDKASGKPYQANQHLAGMLSAKETEIQRTKVSP